jgi:hypothetical protein
MNFKRLFALFFSFSCIGLNAQEPSMDNLYYCNDNAQQWNIYVLSENHFIGHQQGPNNTSLLVLYNRERLPKDTLILGDAKHYFLQSLVPYSATDFTCNTLSSYMNCSIVEDSFVVKEQYENYRTFPQAGLPQEDKKLGNYQKLGKYIFVDATSKQGWKYPDDLWLLNEANGNIELMSASLSKDKRNQNYSKMLTINLQYDSENKVIYKMDVDRNVLLIVDAEEGSYQSIPLPSIKKHSWYCFLDKSNGQLYAINYSAEKSDEPNKCYKFDWRANEMTFVRYLSGSPILIDNGQYFFWLKEGENMKDCFYHEPLTGKFEKKVILDEIKINK